MPRVQELFQRADGSKLLDVKLLMRIQSLPSQPSQKTTDAGQIVDYFPVVLEHQGQEYNWELGEAQIHRIFSKTTKEGQVIWQGKDGDEVNVWYASPKTGKFPYFAAEPADGTELHPVMLTDGAGQVPPSAKPRFIPTKREETKWDGTPRQSGFRQAYAGLTQALLSNPNVDVTDEAQVDSMLALARRLVPLVRQTAMELEQSIKD